MTTLAMLTPIASEIRFKRVELDGTYSDYYFEQRTAGQAVQWRLTHDLEDDTWAASIEFPDKSFEATEAQVEALLACLTEEQRLDASLEAREQYRGFLH